MKFLINIIIIFALFSNRNLLLSNTLKKNFNSLNKNITTSENTNFNIKKKNLKTQYNRKAFLYKPYYPNTNIGFFTQNICTTNIDHVVSLKDAFESGAKLWSLELKKKFSNDKVNHVASCLKVNSSKGSSGPKDFLRKSRDGKGMDYNILNFCSYVSIYYRVKVKYKLSFDNNSAELFYKCGFKIIK